MRRIVAPVCALAVVALATACSDNREGQVEDYVERANAIQDRAAPFLRRANTAYARFSSGDLSADSAPAELARAERFIRSTRAVLAGLEPPSDARDLHTRLLRFLDLNVGLARESTQLAEYLPQAESALRRLPPASRRLGRDLRSASEPGEQRRALARYRRHVERTADGLARLSPPPLLAASHARQLRRLRSVRSLAEQLGRAVRARDARAVARLLLRFRRGQREGSEGVTADARSLRAYERRYRATGRAAADIRRAEAELRRTIE